MPVRGRVVARDSREVASFGADAWHDGGCRPVQARRCGVMASGRFDRLGHGSAGGVPARRCAAATRRVGGGASVQSNRVLAVCVQGPSRASEAASGAVGAWSH